MSYWTNVILSMSSLDLRKYRWIIHKEIKNYCDFGRFEEIELYGGKIFVGEFESFSEERFKKWLLSLDWEFDEHVELFTKGENDDIYKVWYTDKVNYELLEMYRDESI